jgi:hypothetical protein
VPSREDVAAWFQRFGITGVVFESGDTFEGLDESTTGSSTGQVGVAISSNGSDDQGVDYQGIDVVPTSFSTDGSGNVVGVEFSSGTTVQVNVGTPVESGVESDLGVSWGRWEGPNPGDFTVNGAPAERGNLAFAITDNLTEPTTLASLNGTLDYGNPVGPKPFDTAGAPWTVDALSLGVNFDLENVTLNQFDLTPDGGGLGLSFDSGDPLSGVTLDLQQNGLSLVVTNPGGGAVFVGRFVGGAADGMIVAFQANSNQGPQINGTKILTQEVFVVP